jgi:hypothetical protein
MTFARSLVTASVLLLSSSALADNFAFKFAFGGSC